MQPNIGTNYTSLVDDLVKNGLTQIHSGKVRDTFSVPDYPEYLLQLASDRISIFDFVLPVEVLGKGQLLTAMTVFWLEKVLRSTCPNHLVAFGSGIDEYLPEPLQGSMNLQSRAIVVKKLEMLSVECVVRGYLTGSGWAEYQKTGMVCGHKLPKGLYDGSQLERPIFTPTTKSQVGHDEALDFKEVKLHYGEGPERLALIVYDIALNWARERRVIIADTKFEFGKNLFLADEVLTPDSSRFWDIDDWSKAREQHKSPAGYDKQFMRNYGAKLETPFVTDGKPIVGLKNLDPQNQEHRTFVATLVFPEEVIQSTVRLYLDIFRRIVGTDVTTFQDKVMLLRGTK